MTDRSIESSLDRKNRYTHIQTHTHTYIWIHKYIDTRHRHTHLWGFVFVFLVDFCLFPLLFLAINLARSWFQAKNWNQAPAMKVLSLTHWATREVPLSVFFICTLSLLFLYFFGICLFLISPLWTYPRDRTLFCKKILELDFYLSLGPDSKTRAHTCHWSE